MALGSCIDCWETVCVCGKDYKDRSVEWIERQILMLQGVLEEKKGAVQLSDGGFTTGGFLQREEAQKRRMKVTLDCLSESALQEASDRVVKSLGLVVYGKTQLPDGRLELLLLDPASRDYHDAMAMREEQRAKGINPFDGLDEEARLDMLSYLLKNPLMPLKAMNPNANDILAQMADRYSSWLDISYHYTAQERPEEPLSVGHLAWMLSVIKDDHSKSYTKRHRWLGFVQGVLLAKYDFYDLAVERKETRVILRGM